MLSLHSYTRENSEKEVMDDSNCKDEMEPQKIDSNECGFLQQLATSAELPEQILECLIHCGYDKVSSVAEIGDIQPMQTFLRENHFLFENSPKQACIYGVFASAPEKFTFLPGHVACLNKFIKICKAQSKSAVLPETVKRITGRTRRRPIPRPTIKRTTLYSTTGSYRLAKGQTMISLPNDGTVDNAVGNLDVSNSPKSPFVLPSPCGDEITLQANGTSVAVNEMNSTMALDLDVYTQIKRKMQRWTQTHKDIDVQKLKLDEHYKIIVKQHVMHSPQSDYQEEIKIDLDVSLLCCICSSQVRLLTRKNSFLISNATRHLLNCVKNPPSTRRKHKHDALTARSRDNQCQCDLDIEETSAVNIVEVQEMQIEHPSEYLEPNVVNAVEFLIKVHNEQD